MYRKECNFPNLREGSTVREGKLKMTVESTVRAGKLKMTVESTVRAGKLK